MVIVAIGAPALWPYLFGHKALYWGDIELYFAPTQTFLAHSLARGIIPLWNPLILCGEPFVGAPQTWLLYPSALFAGLFGSPWRYLTVDVAVHALLGGLLFYPLARDSGLSRAASILASVVFMLGGYFVTKFQFPNMAQAIAYAPLIVLLSGRLAAKPSARYSVLLGAAVGLQLLAAHAQITLLSLYLAAAYGIFRGLPAWRAGRGLVLRAGAFALAAFVLAAALDAGQLLPAIEAWRHSDREVLTLATANRFVLQPSGLAGFILPDPSGSPFDGDFKGRGNYWEPACYLGVVPALLAIIGTAAGVKRRFPGALFWISALTVSVWLAFGRTAGLFTAAYYLLPGVHAFHDPARMLMGAAVAAPLLSGIGLDSILAISFRSSRMVIKYAPAALILFVTGCDLARYDRRAYPLMPVSQIEASIKAAETGDFSLHSDSLRLGVDPDNRKTWRYFVDYQDFHRRDPGYLRSLLLSHTPNIDMLYGKSDAYGYDPDPPYQSAGRYVRAFDSNRVGDTLPLGNLGVGSLITFEPKVQVGPQGYFHDNSLVAQSLPGAARARLTASSYGPVEVRDVSPNEVEIDLPRLPRPSGLVLADTYAPGWNATLAGRNVSIDRTVDGLRRISLPASDSPQRLVFRYEPCSWRVGLYLTLLAVSFALGFAAHAVSSSVMSRSLQR